MDADKARGITVPKQSICYVVMAACDQRIKDATKRGDYFASCNLFDCLDAERTYEKRGFRVLPLDGGGNGHFSTNIEW